MGQIVDHERCAACGRIAPEDPAVIAAVAGLPVAYLCAGCPPWDADETFRFFEAQVRERYAGLPIRFAFWPLRAGQWEGCPGYRPSGSVVGAMRARAGAGWEVLIDGPRGWWRRVAPFTAAEVSRRLIEDPPGPRAEAVRRCLARPAEWLPPDPHFARCPLRYHAHLARIVFWYARGESLTAIDRHLGGGRGAATEAPAELAWAVAEACRRIAACLNSAPRDYGL